MKAALKEFTRFPAGARERMLQALDLAAEGRMAGIAKPMTGLGPGVFEIALRYRTDAYRVVYALRLADEIWVLHAFEKKSRTGIKTPKQEIDVVRERIRRLKDMLE